MRSLRFIGGPWDGQRRTVDQSRWHVLDERGRLHRSIVSAARGELEQQVPFPPTVVYVRAKLMHAAPVEGAEYVPAAGLWVETVMAEERFYDAELEAQETQERRVELRAEAFRRFADTTGWRHRPPSELVGKGEPDLSAFVRRNYLRATVWSCGDDYCDCSQARIEGWDYAYDLDGNACEWPQPGVFAIPRFRDPDGRYGTLDLVWSGRFFTDGEMGAADDLAFVRVYLREFAADIEQRIRWPADLVPYSLEP